MRKIIFILAGLFIFKGQFAHAVHYDTDGNTYVNPAVFFASITATGDQFATILASQTAVFGGVIITNPGNPGAQVAIMDGSNNLICSTISATSANPVPYCYDVKTSSAGLKYNNLNGTAGGTTAQITILWQYKGASDPLRTK